MAEPVTKKARVDSGGEGGGGGGEAGLDLDPITAAGLAGIKQELDKVTWRGDTLA
jgi:hypothetical protein